MIAEVWLLAVAIIRALGSGAPGEAVGVLQLLPTIVLVLYLALLLELAASDYGPAAADNAAGTTVAAPVDSDLVAAPVVSRETDPPRQPRPSWQLTCRAGAAPAAA